MNVQQCLTCLTGSWPSPCLSACLLTHHWGGICLMCNCVTTIPWCVCVWSPHVNNITAFEFTYAYTTCSIVLNYYNWINRWNMQEPDPDLKRLIRVRQQLPPPLCLMRAFCFVHQTHREREMVRERRTLMCLVWVKASWFWWQHQGFAAQTNYCSVSRTEVHWALAFLFPPVLLTVIYFE